MRKSGMVRNNARKQIGDMIRSRNFNLDGLGFIGHLPTYLYRHFFIWVWEISLGGFICGICSDCPVSFPP